MFGKVCVTLSVFPCPLLFPPSSTSEIQISASQFKCKCDLVRLQAVPVAVTTAVVWVSYSTSVPRVCLLVCFSFTLLKLQGLRIFEEFQRGLPAIIVRAVLR